MTLGQVIRAYRLRWGRLPSAEGMMRVSYGSHGGYLCEFCPLGQVPKQLSHGTEYVIWWEKDLGKGLIDSSPFLRSLRKIKQPFTVLLGEEGELMQKVS